MALALSLDRSDRALSSLRQLEDHIVQHSNYNNDHCPADVIDIEERVQRSQAVVTTLQALLSAGQPAPDHLDQFTKDVQEFRRTLLIKQVSRGEVQFTFSSGLELTICATKSYGIAPASVFISNVSHSDITIPLDALTRLRASANSQCFDTLAPLIRFAESFTL